MKYVSCARVWVPAVTLLVAFVLYVLWPDSASQKDAYDALTEDVGIADSTPDERPAGDSPFALRIEKTQLDGPVDMLVQRQANGGSDSPDTAAADAAMPLPSLDGPMSEAEFTRWVEQLRLDPELLGSLIDQFRQESDPVVKQRIASLLGTIGGEEITQLAGELVSSGDADSRTLGMSLLQDVQPGNARAREMVSGMLSTALDTPVLIDALTALADPGEVDDDSRGYLADQVALLTSHEDDGVRSISLDVLSRWSAEPQYTDILASALDDESQYVRAAAAYALVGRNTDDLSTLIDRLFSVASDPDETKRVKRASLQALKSLSLTVAQLAQVNSLQRQINTVAR